MELKNKEIRAFNFEIRAEEDETRGTHLTGRPIVYNSRTDMGWYDEIIDAGALDETDLKDVPLLVNHDTNKLPLARSRNNNENSSMYLSPDGDGMEIDAAIDIENNADSRALWSAVGRGDVSGMSFMFIVDVEMWEDIDTEHPTRRIQKISKVFEVSAVTWPAYEDTSISQRGLSGALDSAKESLESARAELRKAERQKQKIRILMEV